MVRSLIVEMTLDAADKAKAITAAVAATAVLVLPSLLAFGHEHVTVACITMTSCCDQTVKAVTTGPDAVRRA